MINDRGIATRIFFATIPILLMMLWYGFGVGAAPEMGCPEVVEVYCELAKDPFAGCQFYGYRLFYPVIIWLLGTDCLMTFIGINILALSMGNAYLYLWVRKLGFSVQTGMWAAFCFAFSGVVNWNIGDPIHVNGTALCFMIAGMYYLECRKLVPFAIMVTIGSLAKENALFILPCVYFVLGGDIKKTFQACWFPTLIYLAVRIALPGDNIIDKYFGEQSLLQGDGKTTQWFSMYYEIFFGAWAKAKIFGCYSVGGLLWFLAINKKALPILRKYWPYAVIVLPFMSAICADTIKHTQLIVPLLIAMSCPFIDKLTGSGKVLFAFMCLATFINYRWNIDCRGLRYFIVGSGTVAGVVVALYAWSAIRDNERSVAYER